MKTLDFTIEINASTEKVWFALWDDVHYREWTSAFHEGSYYKTDWKEGGGIQFIDSQGNGMYSVVSKNQPFEKMYFTHIGEIKNFEELPLDDVSSTWTNGKEHYSLKENVGVTTLLVSLDMMEDEKIIAYFKEAFPKGLAILKELAENLMVVIETQIEASLDAVWEAWTLPEDVMKWNSASADWQTTNATNDLREGGKFSITMAAKNGSLSFDFAGTYTHIFAKELIEYKLDDGRKVSVHFWDEDGIVKLVEAFEPENQNSIEFQKAGWQNILDSFKNFVPKKNK